MIKRLIIHRFRGIKEGILDDLGQINLLIGPNNSGKTAVLEMLYLGSLAHRPCSLVNRELEPSVWPARAPAAYDFLGMEAMPRLRQRHGENRVWQESPVDITEDGSLAVGLPEVPKDYLLREFELAAPLDTPGRRRAFSKSDIQRVSMFQLEPWEEGAVPSELIPPIFPKYDVRLEQSFWNYLWEAPFVYRWDQSRGIDHFAVWAMEGTRPEYTLFFDFHAAEQHFAERFASGSYKSIPDWEKKVAKILERVFPELEGAEVSIKPKQGKHWTGFIEFAGKAPIPIDHFGDGARHAFKVLATLTALVEKVNDQRPGIFLWEDPELFMHPATLGRLLEEVMNLVVDADIQVFITTQSLEVITWVASYFNRLSEEKVAKVRSYRLGLARDKLQVHKFEGRGIAGWLHFFGDPRFIGEDESLSPLAHLWPGQEP